MTNYRNSQELELWAKQQRALLIGEYIGDFCLWLGRLFNRLFKRS